MKSIADLYAGMKNGIVDQKEIMTVLPGDVTKDVQRDVLHVFMRPPGNDLFRSGETLYLTEHAEVFIEKDDAFETLFGLLCLSSERIIIASDDRHIELPYADMVWVTMYDEMPQIIEIRGSGLPWMIRVPDAETVYRCIGLIRNKEYARIITEPALSYEEILEKADFDALVFAFEHTLSAGLPEDIRKVIREIASNAGDLRDILRKYPDEMNEAARFLSDHVPSAIRLLASCKENLYSEPGKDVRGRIHDEVLGAADALNEALRNKIEEIRKEAAKKTIAGADALRTGIEQDGLRPGEIRLIF